MISMARTLGAPETVPAGQRGPQHVDRRRALGQLARHLRGEVHDVAVALERHQLVDRARCRSGRPGRRRCGPGRPASRARRAPWGARPARPPRRRSSSSVRPRWRVPAMGREMTWPSSSCTIGSGDGADQRHLGVAHEVHVRAGVDLAQHPVDVERVGVEVEVEALGQHDLEDVAGEDVLLGRLDGRLVERRRPWCEVTSGSVVGRVGRVERGARRAGGRRRRRAARAAATAAS